MFLLTKIRKINKEVLGLNRRNQEYIRPYNPPSAKIIADNKILTKRILAKIGITTPELYKVIRSKKQLEFIDWDSIPKSFVLKPNKGTGGNGIIVFYGKKKNSYEWIRPNGSTMNKKDIILHLENILEGRFSMGNQPDIAILEERVKTDKRIKPYSFKGVPDVRIIAFNNVPIMAQLRLPTKRSNGTANLHSGAICVGIDIASGVTTSGMHLKMNPVIEDTYIKTDLTLDLENNLPIGGITIPYWNDLLEIAIKCQQISGLGYIGVDIAIDQEKGPVIFEINARPGLGIQVANNAGLRWRLEKVRDLKVKNLKHGIRIAKNLFGGQIEEEIENISGKTLISLVEKILVYFSDIPVKKNKPRKKETVNAIMDTGILSSRIDWGLASRIGQYKTLEKFKKVGIPTRFGTLKDAQKYIDQNNDRIAEETNITRLAKISEDGEIKVLPVLNFDIRIAKEDKSVDMIVSKQSSMIYPVMIGRKELKGYLIDTSKTFTK